LSTLIPNSYWTGKDDISQHEKRLANLLHQEIFETGRYFKETSESSSCSRQHFKEKEFLHHQEVIYSFTPDAKLFFI